MRYTMILAIIARHGNRLTVTVTSRRGSARLTLARG